MSYPKDMAVRVRGRGMMVISDGDRKREVKCSFGRDWKMLT